MSDNNVKFLRKQVRNVVQETLPGVLSQEFAQDLEMRLFEYVRGRMDEIKTNVEATLKQMDERSKDIQSYIVNQSMIPIEKNVDAPATEQPKA